ncbi:hypothetical protein CF98_30765 [Halopseudomonas bauzanensis]|nr:hypothetical protein CF98_30765 [Halopseudomonas bauzanensis]
MLVSFITMTETGPVQVEERVKDRLRRPQGGEWGDRFCRRPQSGGRQNWRDRSSLRRYERLGK